MSAYRNLPLLLITLLAVAASPPVSGDCTASSGAVELIEEDGVVVDCGIQPPNPFTTGIGSLGTSSNVTVTVAEDSEVDSASTGVNLGNGGQLSNAGKVTAVEEAVKDTDTSGTGGVEILNSGTLISTGGAGVILGLNGGLVDNSGLIQGQTPGVRVTDSDVINTGTIEALNSDGIGIDAGAGSTVTNDGAIDSAGMGILIGSGGVVTNTGTISAGGVGVRVDGDSTFTNTGAVISDTAVAIQVSAGAEIVNGGTVAAGGSDAIRLAGGSTLTLQTGSDVGGRIASSGSGGGDTLVLEGTGVEDDAIEAFAALNMRGESWSLSGNVQALAVGIESGRLVINGTLDTRDGSLSPGSVSLTNGSLSGIGTIIGDVNNSGGTISTDDPVGTLNISGNYVQGENGTYRAGSTGGSIGLLAVEGTASLAGTLVVTAGSDSIAEILTADGGISGAFDEVVVDGRSVVAVATTANAVQLIRASTTVQDNQIDAALDNVYLALDNLSEGVVEAGASGLWAKAMGYYGKRQERDELVGGDWITGGASVGGDWMIGGHTHVGAAVGFTRTDLEVDDGSEVDADNLFYGAYVEHDGQRIWAKFAITAGTAETDQTGKIFVGTVSQSTSASFDQKTFGVRGGIGARMDFTGGNRGVWLFEPMFIVDYVTIDQDPYVESGGADLRFSTAQDIESLQLSGLLRSRRISGESKFTPRFHLGVVYREALDDRTWIGLDSETGTSLLLQGDDGSVTNFAVGAGTEFTFNPRLTGFVDWFGEFGKYKSRNMLSAGIRLAI